MSRPPLTDIFQQNDAIMADSIDGMISSYAVSCLMEVLKDIIQECVRHDAEKGRIISSASFYVRRATALFLENTSCTGSFPAYIPPSISRFEFVAKWVEACVSYELSSDHFNSVSISRDDIKRNISDPLFNRSNIMYEGIREELWGYTLSEMGKYE